MTTPFMYFKVFGERNTGTNYLIQLIRTNFFVQELRGDAGLIFGLSVRMARDVPAGERRRRARLHMVEREMARIRSADLGWKHGAPNLALLDASPIAHDTLFVVVTKHPYAFLRSLHRRPHDLLKEVESFSEFIRMAWPVGPADELPRTVYPSCVAMLREKLVAYRRLLASPYKVLHLRYEDTLFEPETTLETMAPHLPARGPAFELVEADTKDEGRTPEDFRRLYAPESIARMLEPEDRAYVVDLLGPEMFEAFGYTPY